MIDAIAENLLPFYKIVCQILFQFSLSNNIQMYKNRASN